MEALVLALVGGATMITLTAAIWLPIHARESTMRRRIAGFVDAGSGRTGGLAMDLGGRARRRLGAAQPGKYRGRLVRGIERRIAKAQVNIEAGEFLIGVGLGSVGALVLFSVLAGPLAGAVAAAAIPVLGVAWLAQKAARVQRRFLDQFADTVALLASSVRSGHSVQQALEHVSHEAAEPTRSAFALMVREIGFGASMDDALGRLAERYPSEDMELVTTAINVHSAIGGSLAKVLDAAADTIRERARMAAEIKALTAQQQYSAYVLALLPVFTLVALKLISPDYADELFKGSLRLALLTAGILVLTGFTIMKKMATIDE